MIDKTIARKQVAKWIYDSFEHWEYDIQISKGIFNTEYINKNYLLFVIEFGVGRNELVHVKKIAKGYQLIRASCCNWSPAKEHCIDYEFIPLANWN